MQPCPQALIRNDPGVGHCSELRGAVQEIQNNNNRLRDHVDCQKVLMCAHVIQSIKKQIIQHFK